MVGPQPFKKLITNVRSPFGLDGSPRLGLQPGLSTRVTCLSPAVLGQCQKCLLQLCAAGVKRVRKPDESDSKLPQGFLDDPPLLRSTPIISHEEPGGSKMLACMNLVVALLWNYLVNVPDASNDLATFFEWDERPLPLHS